MASLRMMALSMTQKISEPKPVDPCDKILERMWNDHGWLFAIRDNELKCVMKNKERYDRMMQSPMYSYLVIPDSFIIFFSNALKYCIAIGDGDPNESIVKCHKEDMISCFSRRCRPAEHTKTIKWIFAHYVLAINLDANDFLNFYNMRCIWQSDLGSLNDSSSSSD